MTALLGYLDPISVAPGERLRVMVSCIGAGRYDAELVRLINPQAWDRFAGRFERVFGFRPK